MAAISEFKNNQPQSAVQYGTTATAALLEGAGTSSSPYSSGTTADKNFIGYWLKTTALSGTTRGVYLRLYIAGAGCSGEAARIFTTVNGVAGGTGGIHGAHITGSLDATGTCGGLLVGCRATLGVSEATRSLSGTFAALQVDSDIGTGNTMPGTTSFIRVANNNSVAIANLFEIPTGVVTRKGSAPSASDGLACRINGALAYIMVGT
jgi:hypothetical protein